MLVGRGLRILSGSLPSLRRDSLLGDSLLLLVLSPSILLHKVRGVRLFLNHSHLSLLTPLHMVLVA